MTTRKKQAAQTAPPQTIHEKLVASMNSGIAAGFDWPSMLRVWGVATPPGATRADIQKALGAVAQEHGYSLNAPPAVSPALIAAAPALLQAAEYAEALAREYEARQGIGESAFGKRLRAAIAAAKGVDAVRPEVELAQKAEAKAIRLGLASIAARKQYGRDSPEAGTAFALAEAACDERDAAWIAANAAIDKGHKGDAA